MLVHSLTLSLEVVVSFDVQLTEQLPCVQVTSCVNCSTDSTITYPIHVHSKQHPAACTEIMVHVVQICGCAPPVDFRCCQQLQGIPYDN